MKSILLIVPYFGKWPIWFEAYLVSIEKNSTVNWLIVTDCEIPEHYPSNILFVSTNLKELNQKVNSVVGATVPLTPRKFCDLKPAYGDIFNEYIQGYDFWGFCDVDIIWGDIRKFMTDDVLTNYDIISSRKEAISGHFNLFRNDAGLNYLFKQIPNYQKMFESSKLTRFDEAVLTDFILDRIKNKVFNYRMYWAEILLNQEKGIDSRQEYYLDRWHWKNGKMINTLTKQEVMYLHFINWKKNMKSCEVEFKNEINSFYISHSSIHLQLHTNLQVKWNDFRNIFDGYYVRLWRKELKKKWQRIKKKFLNVKNDK